MSGVAPSRPAWGRSWWPVRSSVIAEAIDRAGGTAVLTDPELPSGTDRIFEALHKIDAEGRYDRIVNVQGDLPTLDPVVVRRVVEPLDMLGMRYRHPRLANGGCRGPGRAERRQGRRGLHSRTIRRSAAALYFTRAPAPYGPGPSTITSGCTLSPGRPSSAIADYRRAPLSSARSSSSCALSRTA